jgi:hypothetical protein
MFSALHEVKLLPSCTKKNKPCESKISKFSQVQCSKNSETMINIFEKSTKTERKIQDLIKGRISSCCSVN